MGPATSKPAAVISQPTAQAKWRRSGRAARRNREMARAAWARMEAALWLTDESGGIEAGLQLLVFPLAGVPAFGRQQGGVAAPLRDAAVAQHHDQVGVGDGRQAVAGDDGAAARVGAAQGLQVFEDARFGARVDGGEG